MRNVLILKGSPRRSGNSAVLAEQAAEGARAAGAQVESIYLHGLDIRPCDACDLCLEQGDCVIEDDMQPLYPKLAAADAILLASPVYWFTFSAQLKLCIDRWYGFQARPWKEISGKHFGIILTYGDSDLYTSGAINAIHTFETMCRFLKGRIAGIVHGSLSEVGDAEKHPELLEQAYQLGEEFGEEVRLSSLFAIRNSVFVIRVRVRFEIHNLKRITNIRIPEYPYLIHCCSVFLMLPGRILPSGWQCLSVPATTVPWGARSLRVDHALEIAHVVEIDLSLLQADEGTVVAALVAFLDQVFQAQACQPGGLDAVKGGGVAALLQVAQDGRAHIEHIPAFLFEQGAHEGGVVDLRWHIRRG